MPKITMQDIADALNTSRVTVWKAFNNRNGVSDTLRAQILQKADELGYSRYIPDPPSIAPTKHKTVALIVSRPESSIFWTNIIHQIAKEFSMCNMDLIYTYVPTTSNDGYTLPASLSDGTISGCIILNVYDIRIIRQINELEIPKVFLDTVTDLPPEELQGDLVLLEGRYTMFQLTNYILNHGYTRLGFIGDVHYAKTNALRYDGFKDAMHSRNLKINPDYCLDAPLELSNYDEQILDFLRKLPEMPQGFICASDYVAHVVQSYLVTQNIRIPEDIILTGYDGCTEHPALSQLSATVEVETATLGTRLARQLLFRMDNPVDSREIIYVISDIVHPSFCPTV